MWLWSEICQWLGMWLCMWTVLPPKAVAFCCITVYLCGFGFWLSICALLCFQSRVLCQGKLKNSFTFLCHSRQTVNFHEECLIFCHCTSAVWLNNWKLSCRSDLLGRVVVIYEASKIRPYLTSMIQCVCSFFHLEVPSGTQASFASVPLFLRFTGNCSVTPSRWL